jgi:hypothetical protein
MGGGSAPIPDSAQRQLKSVGKILNIGWISEGAARNATIICPRSSGCPRKKNCLGSAARGAGADIEDIRQSLSGR